MKVSLRKIKKSDIRYFKKWWQDKTLAKFTSGKTAKENEIPLFFETMQKNSQSTDYMILAGNKTIGHIALNKRDSGWYETNIVIGEKKLWGKGIGTEAKRQILLKAKRMGIKKVFVEVRPDNIRSIKASEKCGFKKKKIIRRKNKNLPITIRMEKIL